MKFTFYLTNCAYGNSEEARLRESTRLGLICLGMRKLGIAATIADAPEVLRESPRWPFFVEAYEPNNHSGLRVSPAEQFRTGLASCPVAVKTAVGTQRDARFVRQCKVYVAHEYAPEIEDYQQLLPVPFMIHDRVLSDFVGLGLFQAFIDNDITTIRAHFQCKKERRLGFCGCGWPHRKKFCEDAPDWADIRFYESHPMSGAEHAQWLMGCEAGLCLSGDSPKTNLPSLCALLGVPIVWQQIKPKDTPQFTAFNTIPFLSWAQVDDVLSRPGYVYKVVENATNDYLNGWSHIGQAKSIIARFA